MAMCGRFVGNFNTQDLVDEIGESVREFGLTLRVPDFDGPLMQNFNVAPTHVVPILRVIGQEVVVDVMRWGLIPIWAKDASIGAKMINARSETITEKPSFKGLVPGHRCVIPMNGFYEWNRENPKAKVPYFVSRSDGHLMLAAGIWSDSPIVDEGRTFSLITRDSVEDLSAIHDRSAVEFTAQDAVEWMAATQAPLELFAPEHQPRFKSVRVSSRVNSVRNNDSDLLREDSPPEEEYGELRLF
jgi:putative SOS response-associated peptidase YedK